MLEICYENTDLDAQQKRIINKSIESFEVRGIALDTQKQSRLKEISKELSKLSQKFSNNVLDSQKLFEYIVEDESILSEMPEDDKNAAIKRAEEKKKS
jgi:Zn-dependent oligopeptidase